MSNTSLPPITITPEDRRELARLARAGGATADYLAREIERARVLEPDGHESSFVRMGSQVEFRDDVSRERHRVTVVYPSEADIAARKISVLTPVGAALIGLSKGQSIEWQTPAGEPRRLTVLRIEGS